MSSSLDDALIMEEALHDFSRQLHSAFPPRNFGEFHDEEQLKEKIQQLKEDVSKNFFSKVWNRDREQVFSLLKKLRNRMDKEVIAELMDKNKEHKMGSVSYLLKRAEMLCEDFQMELEDQLLRNPYVEIDSLKNFVDQQKEFAVNYFDGIWEAGCSQIKKERQAKMIKNLDAIGEELLDKHKHFLESQSVNEGKNLVEQVKTILVEKSRVLKSYVDSHPGQVSNRYLKAEVEDMTEYLLNGKGATLRESEKEIYSKLMETLVDGIKFLTEEGNKENANSPEGFSQWVEGLYLKFIKYCFNPNYERGRNDGQGVQQERAEAECDSSERPSPRWITMQRKFREDSCGSWEQEEVEPENMTPEEGSTDNMNKNIAFEGVEKICTTEEGVSSRSYDQSESAPSGMRTMRRRRSRPCNSSSARDKNQTLIDEKCEAATHVCLTKKRRTATKTGNYVRTGQTSKVNNKTTDSAQTTPSRRSSRLKKKLVEPDLTPKTTAVPDNATRQSLSLIYDEMSGEEENENTVATDSLEHSSFNPEQITLLRVDPPLYQCKLCKKKYKTKCFIRYHEKNCIQEHKCGQCGKVFRKKCNYRKHLRTHTDEKAFKCPTCNKQFAQRNSLNLHITCHKEPSFHCEKCKRSFRRRFNLKRHMLWHDEKLPFGCSYCNRRCTSLTDLKTHVLTHSDERPFDCATCKRQFYMKCQLVRHLQRIHGMPREEADKQANDAAREYLRKAMKNPNYDGDTSSMVVVSHAIKKANLRISVGPDTIVSAEATPRRSICFDQITILGGNTCKCDVCGKVIQGERFLRFHGKNCEERRNRCDNCNKKFIRPIDLVIHLRTHTGEKPFKCPTCSKQFSNKSNLRTHLLFHSREARFPCPQCKRKFYQRFNLKRHMLKHEGEAPFGCNYCDQRCATLGLLKTHVMVHCDERPYKCPTCDRSFSWKPPLVRHIQRHHHKSKEEARKLANEAGVEYLRNEHQVFNDTISYSRLDSVVLSHAIKKANLKLCEPPSLNKS